MGGFLGKIYAFKAFDDLVLIYPLYAVMFVDHGLSPAQVSILLATWSTTAFLLEAPSGVIADRFSRKHILAAAQMTRALGYACWLVFPSFWGFLAGFVLWGIKSAFTSGTFEALVYDELDAAGRADDFTKVLGRARSLSFVGSLAASGGAALLAGQGYGLLLGCSVAAGLAATTALMLLPAACRTYVTTEVSYLGHLGTSLREAWVLPAIRGPLLFVSLILGLAALDEYWPIFGKLARLDASQIALFMGGFNIALVIAAAGAHRLRRLDPRWFYGLVAIASAIFAIAALKVGPWSILAPVLFSGAFKLADTVFEGRLQAAIPTERRATISSLTGLFSNIGAVAVFLVFGGVAAAVSYGVAFATFGGVAMLAGLAYLANAIRRPSPA
jgi:MFS family permease